MTHKSNVLIQRFDERRYAVAIDCVHAMSATRWSANDARDPDTEKRSCHAGPSIAALEALGPLTSSGSVRSRLSHEAAPAPSFGDAPGQCPAGFICDLTGPTMKYRIHRE
jgi:hypothetical protein